MLYLDTNGTHVKPRATILPPAPHPPGQGACSEEAPYGECSKAYAVEDDRDTVEDVEI